MPLAAQLRGFFTANIFPSKPSTVFRVTVMDLAVQTRLTEKLIIFLACKKVVKRAGDLNHAKGILVEIIRRRKEVWGVK